MAISQTIKEKVFTDYERNRYETVVGQIQEYDDALTARIIEKITVRSRNEIEIRFIGGYKKAMQLT